MERNLRQEDIGRLVTYTSKGGDKIEHGRITSFNERYVFVDYDNTGRGKATNYEDLNFQYEKILY